MQFWFLKKLSMHKLFSVMGALLAGLAVAMGAFGAHGLQQITQDPKIIHTYQTAVQYQCWHAIALLVTGLLPAPSSGRFHKWAGLSFIVGILFFSGSLYVITYLKLHQLPVRFWGPVTPIGGLFFIAGWALLALSFLKNEGSN